MPFHESPGVIGPDVPLPTVMRATPKPVRLGLALSGGGFRASLFHLGVLTRLAELDLLRHLHVISAVSGGSVLAAHYMLLLKGALEASPDGRLSRTEYSTLVARLRTELSEGLRHDLRNRLLLSPMANLRMICLGLWRGRTTLASRMEQLYQRHLYARATESLAPSERETLAHGIRLSDMVVRLRRLDELKDLNLYNALPHRDCVPRLVMNAATLNTASRFTFTFTEVGDEALGYVRTDERAVLTEYKRSLDAPSQGPGAQGAPRLGRTLPRSGGDAVSGAESKRPAWHRSHTAAHLDWWRAAEIERDSRQRQPWEPTTPSETSESGARFGVSEPSTALRYLTARPNDSARFLNAPLNSLRMAKVAAWYLLSTEAWEGSGSLAPGGPQGAEPIRRGGFTREEHGRRFWSAIRDIDKVMAEELRKSTPFVEQDWHEFVLELYYFRTAANLELADPKAILLSTAVQASANFPPVFGPLRLDGLYDRRLLRALQLSDGGLNDNNGLEALLDERCTHIITSEAGPAPVLKSPVRFNRAGMMGQIVMNQLPIVRRLLLRTLREHARVHEALQELGDPPAGFGPKSKVRELWERYPVEAMAFFHMDSKLSDGVPEDESPVPLPEHPLAKDVARLRTDLDGFCPIEQDALLYQGYQYCDRFVRRYVYPDLLERGLVEKDPPAPRAPATLPEAAAARDHASRVLQAGGSRLFRAGRIGGQLHLWRASATGLLIALWGLIAVGVSRAVCEVRELLASRVGEPGFMPTAGIWILGSLMGLWLALDVFGFWLWADGRLATWAARRR